MPFTVSILGPSLGRAAAWLALGCLPVVLSFSALAAEKHPTRPIRLIVPFPPGGSNDIVGRLIGVHLTERLGNPDAAPCSPGAAEAAGNRRPETGGSRARRADDFGGRRAGLRGVQLVGGIVAPAGTPAAVTQRLYSEITAIVASQDVQKWFATEGAEAVNKTPEEFRKLIASEIVKWGKVVKEAGLKAEF